MLEGVGSQIEMNTHTEAKHQLTFAPGADFTFDAADFCSLVDEVSRPLEDNTSLFAPEFDHAVKDPVEKAIAINPTHRIVIFEGLCV